MGEYALEDQVKANIHPEYHKDARVVCASCGTTFETGSTRQELRIDVCSNCHPFYTGQQRIIDTGGQVERFRRRLAAAKKQGA
jgi:large subunit ribosomal protein L31